MIHLIGENRTTMQSNVGLIRIQTFEPNDVEFFLHVLINRRVYLEINRNFVFRIKNN